MAQSSVLAKEEASQGLLWQVRLALTMVTHSTCAQHCDQLDAQPLPLDRNHDQLMCGLASGNNDTTDTHTNPALTM